MDKVVEVIMEFEGLTPAEMKGLSFDELVAYNIKVGLFKDRVRDEQRQVHRELSRRKALDKFEGMSDEEKRAVAEHLAKHPPAQTISAVGIGSLAQLGNLGND